MPRKVFCPNFVKRLLLNFGVGSGKVHNSINFGEPKGHYFSMEVFGF